MSPMRRTFIIHFYIYNVHRKHLNNLPEGYGEEGRVGGKSRLDEIHPSVHYVHFENIVHRIYNIYSINNEQ